MVSLDDYIDDDEEGAADFDGAEGRLKALADAVASTNLAVMHAAQGDAGGATQRVQASVAALTRFHAAFTAAGRDAGGGGRGGRRGRGRVAGLALPSSSSPGLSGHP